MKLSIPGLPGVYYDTDAGSTAMTVALTAAGRRAPKPHGYAVQLLPYLWGFNVDLREVPNGHPLQYLHPEGARSIQEFTRTRNASEVARDFDLAVRTAWAINGETERGLERLFGLPEHPDDATVVIEIHDGELELREAEDDSGEAVLDPDGDAEVIDLGADDEPPKEFEEEFEVGEFQPDELGSDSTESDDETDRSA